MVCSSDKQFCGSWVMVSPSNGKRPMNSPNTSGGRLQCLLKRNRGWDMCFAFSLFDERGTGLSIWVGLLEVV